MRVEADRELCCGSGNCVLSLPDVFDQDDEEGLVVLRRSELPDEMAPALAGVVARCPSGAISTR
jgi:ferredoxin